MKPLLLATLLLPLMAHAADWASVGTAAGSKSYIDKASVMRSGSGYKVWSLESFTGEQSTQDGQPYTSVKALQVYACGARTVTLLSQVYYSEAMGKGQVVQNIKFEKFSPEDIIPDSSQEMALQSVCKRAAPARAGKKK